MTTPAEDTERIYRLATDPAHRALLRENADLRERLDAALATPPADAPLDVRLLGDAIDRIEWPPSIYALGYRDQRWIDAFAAAIAAEYARLTDGDG